MKGVKVFWVSSNNILHLICITNYKCSMKTMSGKSFSEWLKNLWLWARLLLLLVSQRIGSLHYSSTHLHNNLQNSNKTILRWKSNKKYHNQPHPNINKKHLPSKRKKCQDINNPKKHQKSVHYTVKRLFCSALKIQRRSVRGVWIQLTFYIQ